jgi:hypothetical protein
VDDDIENTIVLPEVLMTKLQISLATSQNTKNSIRNSKPDRMSCERIPPGIINLKKKILRET